MSFVHLHLVLTHFPPVLTLVALVAAVSALVVRKRRGELLQLTLLLIVVTGAMMPAIYFAGVRTADVIGKVEGIQQDAIGPHQHAAIIALSICIVAALVALGLFIAERRHAGLSSRLRLLVLVLAVSSASSIGWTAALGGAIHHPEIHS